MRRKLPDLAEALAGHIAPTTTRCWSGRCCTGWTTSRKRLAELDVIIAAAMAPWSHQLRLLQVIIAETGGDIARFPTAAHLAAWAGVAPAMHESADKRRPAGSREGNKWLASMLVEAASSVSRSKSSYLATQYARIASRRGRKRAAVRRRTRCWCRPTTCSSATSPTGKSATTGSTSGTPTRTRRRLVAQLKRLGHTVVLDPADSRAWRRGETPRRLHKRATPGAHACHGKDILGSVNLAGDHFLRAGG
jgi:hypothetical protein